LAAVPLLSLDRLWVFSTKARCSTQNFSSVSDFPGAPFSGHFMRQKSDVDHGVQKTESSGETEGSALALETSRVVYARMRRARERGCDGRPAPMVRKAVSRHAPAFSLPSSVLPLPFLCPPLFCLLSIIITIIIIIIISLLLFFFFFLLLCPPLSRPPGEPHGSHPRRQQQAPRETRAPSEAAAARPSPVSIDIRVHQIDSSHTQ
jgi:hypothetical protein